MISRGGDEPSSSRFEHYLPESAFLFICVSSAAHNRRRRDFIRKSWFRYLHASDSPLTNAQRGLVTARFLMSAECWGEVQAEQGEHRDIMFADVPDGYEHLWRRTMAALKILEERCRGQYWMHVDDDSFLRVDLLLPVLEVSPTRRFYWGYIWNLPGNPVTAPIRNPNNKSHMPLEQVARNPSITRLLHEAAGVQYAEDWYPPFASGCGFVLSRDLVTALVAVTPMPDYRLLDPPFGIHLCGPQSCLPDGAVTPVHDGRVRPYRPMPMFRNDTIVQHYLQPEEMLPFMKKALEYPVSQGDVEMPEAEARIASFYDSLVDMGLLRR